MSFVSRAVAKLERFDWLPDRAFKISALLLILFEDGNLAKVPVTTGFLLMDKEVGIAFQVSFKNRGKPPLRK